jgi:DNA-directed RNA polymerase sigma subunit (sigma70/sigma32)
MTYADKFDPAFTAHLTTLTLQERFILEHYFGLEGKTKLPITAIAEVLRKPGVSTGQVRQTLAQSLYKLRRARDRSSTGTQTARPISAIEGQESTVAVAKGLRR